MLSGQAPSVFVLPGNTIDVEYGQTAMFRVAATDPEGDTLKFELLEVGTNNVGTNYLPKKTSPENTTEVLHSYNSKWQTIEGTWDIPNGFTSESTAIFEWKPALGQTSTTLKVTVSDGIETTSQDIVINIRDYYAPPLPPLPKNLPQPIFGADTVYGCREVDDTGVYGTVDVSVNLTCPIRSATTHADITAPILGIFVHPQIPENRQAVTVTFDLESELKFDVYNSVHTPNFSYVLLDKPAGEMAVSSSGTVTYKNLPPDGTITSATIKVTDTVSGRSTVGRIYIDIERPASDSFDSHPITYESYVPLRYDASTRLPTPTEITATLFSGELFHTDEHAGSVPTVFINGQEIVVPSGFVAATSPTEVTTAEGGTVRVKFVPKGLLSAKHNTSVFLKPNAIEYTPGPGWDGHDEFKVKYQVYKDDFSPAPNLVAWPGNEEKFHVFDLAWMDGDVTVETCGCGGGGRTGISTANGNLTVGVGTSIGLRYDGGTLATPIAHGSGKVNPDIATFNETADRDRTFGAYSLDLDVRGLTSVQDASTPSGSRSLSGLLNGLYAGESFEYDGAFDSMNLPAGEYSYTLKSLISDRSPTINVLRQSHGSFEIDGGAAGAAGLASGWNAGAVDRLVAAPEVTVGTGPQLKVVRPAGMHWIKGDGERFYFEKKPGSGESYNPLPDDKDGWRLTVNTNTYVVSNKYGEKIEFTRLGDANPGNITKRIDATGTTIQSYVFNGPGGKLSKIADALGQETLLTYYDASPGASPPSGYFANRLYEIKEKRTVSGMADDYLTTTLQYDAAGRLKTVVSPLPAGSGVAPKTEFSYADATSKRIASIIDPNMKATSFRYDNHGRIISQSNPDTTSLGLVSAASLWRKSGGTNPINSKSGGQVEFDERGNGTVTAFDVHENVIRSVDSLGNETLYERNLRGDLLKMTEPDPDGPGGSLQKLVTEYQYDSKGNRTYAKYPDGTEEFWTYDPTFSVPTYHKEPVGLNAAGVLMFKETFTTIHQATGLVIYERQVFGLNDLTYPSDTSTAPDSVTTYTYVNDGLPSGTTGLPGGLIETVTDAEGKVTKYEYWKKMDMWENAAAGVAPHALEVGEAIIGKIKTITEAIGQLDTDGATLLAQETKYNYDKLGFLSSVTSPLGTTDYKYDRLGRLVETITPDPDGAGPLFRMKTVNVFDAAGNVERVQTWELVVAAGSTTPTLRRTILNVYDSMNRRIMTAMPNPDDVLPTVPVPSNRSLYPVSEWIYVNGLLDQTKDPNGFVTKYVYDELGRVKTTTLPDPDGPSGTAYLSQVITYAYDNVGNLKSETKYKDATTQVTTTYEYDTQNRKIKETQPDPDGPMGAPGTNLLTSPILTWIYANGQLRSSTDARGNTTEYAYDNLGRTQKVTQPDPDGGGATNPLVKPFVEYTYDKMGRVITEKVQGDSNRVTTHVYNLRGDRRTTTLPAPDPSSPNVRPVLESHYNSKGQMDWSKDALGQRTDYYYDTLGRQTKVQLPDPDPATANDAPTNSARPFTETKYDKFGNVLSTSDFRGTSSIYLTTHTYDALDRRTKTVHPQVNGATGAQPEDNWKYDLGGRLDMQTDAIGVETHYSYWNTGWLKEQKVTGPNSSPVISTQQYGYDTAGNMTTSTIVVPDPVTVPPPDPVANDEITKYGYDNLFRRTWTQEPKNDANHQLKYEYYANGLQKTVSDPQNNKTTYEYDALDRVTSEKNQLGDERKFKYDQFGNLNRKVDRNARVVDYVFDNLNRQTEEKWFAHESAAAVPNAVPERRFVNKYDLAGQLDEVFDEIGAAVKQTRYDYTYDRLGRVTKEDNLNTDPSYAPHVVFDSTYDKANHRTSVAASLGASGNVKDYKNTYIYDSAGNIKEIRQEGQGGSGNNPVAYKKLTFQYDKGGNFKMIGRADTPWIGWEVKTLYQRDDAGRLSNITHQDIVTADGSYAAVVIASYDWTYDDANRIQSFNYDNHRAAVPATNLLYVYDKNGQLAEVKKKGANGGLDTTIETYEYDSAGNRTLALVVATESNGTLNDNVGTSGTYSVDVNNRLKSDGTYAYVYDGEGNRTRQIKIDAGETAANASGATRVFTWDHRNRLTKVTFYVTKAAADSVGNSTTTVEYKYDVHNRRVAKIVDGDENTYVSVNTQFVHDGDQVALVFGNNGKLRFRYLHGPNIDQILAHEEVSYSSQGAVLAGTVNWSLADNLGTVRQIVDASGGVPKAILDYDAFGNPRLVFAAVTADFNHDYVVDGADLAAIYNSWNTDNPLTDLDGSGLVDAADLAIAFNNWGTPDAYLGFLGHTQLYTGRDFDIEVGLQYNRARYYDAKVGRWISEDPIGFAAGDYNLSRYVGNSVTNATDPSGLVENNQYKIQFSPRKLTSSSTGNNGNFSVQWQFELANAIDVPLVIFQEINIHGTVVDCGKGPRPKPFKQRYVEIVGFIKPKETQITISGTPGNIGTVLQNNSRKNPLDLVSLPDIAEDVIDTWEFSGCQGCTEGHLTWTGQLVAAPLTFYVLQNISKWKSAKDNGLRVEVPCEQIPANSAGSGVWASKAKMSAIGLAKSFRGIKDTQTQKLNVDWTENNPKTQLTFDPARTIK